MPKNSPFPKTLFVRREIDSDDTEYLLNYESIDEISDTDKGDNVAIYELVEVKQLVVKKILA